MKLEEERFMGGWDLGCRLVLLGILGVGCDSSSAQGAGGRDNLYAEAGAAGVAGAAGAPNVCPPELVNRARVLSEGATVLTRAASDMRYSVAMACQGFASALSTGGQLVPVVPDGQLTDQALLASCDAAVSAIDTWRASGGRVPAIAIEGWRCTVDTSSQMACEATCAVLPNCSPRTVSQRCDPGQLAGACTACLPGGACEGSAQLPTACAGDCEGICRGTCAGTCAVPAADGSCASVCTGTCTGTCTGKCVLSGASSVFCGDGVSCLGGCSAPTEPLFCEGQLAPPFCEMDADCFLGCEALGGYQATCSPPTVVAVTPTGERDAYALSIETHLPALLVAYRLGELTIVLADELPLALSTVVEQASTVAPCAAEIGVAESQLASAATEAQVTEYVAVAAAAELLESVLGELP